MSGSKLAKDSDEDSDVKHRKEFEKNWTIVLDGLEKAVTY
jgi:hypothetical protein